MPRRPSLSCRQFRQSHAEYVDGLLREEQARAMRAHGDACRACSMRDVRIRRSLLALQTLPTIEPSADFAERLRTRLNSTAVAPQVLHRGVRWGVAGAVTAASVVFVLLAGQVPASRPVSRPVTVRLEPIVALGPEPVSAVHFEPRVPVATAAGRHGEDPRFKALSSVPSGRRAPALLTSPAIRLQLANYPGQ
jgi:anti-sigma-K factor RskA